MSESLQIEKKEVEHTCTNCGTKNKLDIEIHRQKPKIILEESQTETIKEKPVERIVEKELALTHEQMAHSLPTGINVGRCKDGKCGEIIKNPKIIKDFKKCPNCKTNSIPLKKKFCPTCGMKEPDIKDEEFWEESDIEPDKITFDEDENE